MYWIILPADAAQETHSPLGNSGPFEAENISQPPLQAQAFKSPDQASAGYGCIILDMHRLPLKTADDVKKLRDR